MKRAIKLIIYGFLVIAIAFTINFINIYPLTASDRQGETTTPNRLDITVNLSEPDDLKVKEGLIVKVGDIIADRQRERTRLQAQERQLQLSHSRLQSANITPPAAPQSVPPIMALPPVSYLEHQAAVAKTQSAIASYESELELKQEEIEYLSSVKNLDPIILEHERARLERLKLDHTEAVREYQLAMGKMQTAKNSRQYQEYTASIDTARRIEAQNQARGDYQRQLAEYEQRLTDREFQLTQLREKLNDIQNQIATLSVVKSPYNGTVRRVKFLGQSPDGSLSASVTLMVDGREQPAASLSEQQ
jgi:hypothetical protein